MNEMTKIKSLKSTGLVGIWMLLAPAAKSQPAADDFHIIHPLSLEDVRVSDPFWSPRLQLWSAVTINDVFDKLEGKYEPDRQDLIDEKKKMGRTRNGFLNFDLVAQGKRNIGEHDGPPWYDGLIYETIRAAADFLAQHRDAALERRVDGYIERIAAAQASDPDGYINTYTELVQPGKRWGLNGGDDTWQHDVYNSGMLIEAAVHYYKATGKTKLLDVAVKQANYICKVIGPAPRQNVVPGHAGPEEAMLKLYWLFRDNPGLKQQVSVAVDENSYYAMDRYWIEYRGNYGEKDGTHARKSWGSYDQDQMPVLQQKTIEGHAVRATLLATSVTATALENKDPRYIATANHYWDNMIGRRMFITGGEGAIADGERFGPDYDLPESAYLETCAAVGAAFFCQRMNELEADGKYMDEFERALYNNILSGVSLDGKHYFYENPLIAKDNKRWVWHSCPCCPPMFLKVMAALPRYIYAYDTAGIYVNLFIGSEAGIALSSGRKISVKQTTQYPWKGRSVIEVDPASESTFTVNVRIPGWALGKENPFGLYRSLAGAPVTIKVNGKKMPVMPVKGYASIKRTWKKGDVIEVDLPVQPRLVFPNDAVHTLKGKVTLAAGPVIYSLEGTDNPDFQNYTLKPGTSLKLTYKPGLLNGINVINGEAIDTAHQSSKKVSFTAIPFYAIDNRTASSSYEVWMPVN